MDMAVDPALLTYSGGLGVLAGDTLRSAADLGVPMVGVTLLYRKGYVHQRLDSFGNQIESYTEWSPEEVLEPLPARVSIPIEGRQVQLRAWQYFVRGQNGHNLPLILLDTNLEGNEPWDRTLTDHLYGGDDRYRLCQEVVLGYGGVVMLRALGFHDVRVYHMNEGHGAFVTLGVLELLTKNETPEAPLEAKLEKVRGRCVFTTHTPVPAGHDRFASDLVRRVLGEERAAILERIGCYEHGQLNMTFLALCLSRYANGVSMCHGDVSRSMFPGRKIGAITNGVHAVTWTSPPFSLLYDRLIPEWRKDNSYLRYAVSIPLRDIRRTHREAKRRLFEQVWRRNWIQLDEEVLTLGFARRATAYKRADLLFSSLERLRSISRRVGPLQVIYAGKAHPRDETGKVMIRRIFEAAAAIGADVQVVYLENYDLTLGQYLCAGVDVWLNTPLKPQEASGTSGMKAALNGVPSLSVKDGWWLEGHVEGVTGWSLADGAESEDSYHMVSCSLYDKLEHVILPLFYREPDKFAEVMRSAIALNGSFFHTQRMLAQYLLNAYSVEPGEPLASPDHPQPLAASGGRLPVEGNGTAASQESKIHEHQVPTSQDER